MKKVLFFIDTLEDGGVSKVLLDLLKYINKNKYEITVMSLYNLGGCIEKVKEYADYKYCFYIPSEDDKSLSTYIYKKFWSTMLKIPEKFMYRYFIKEKYDVEVAFMHGWSTKFIRHTKYFIKLAIYCPMMFYIFKHSIFSSPLC